MSVILVIFNIWGTPMIRRIQILYASDDITVGALCIYTITVKRGLMNSSICEARTLLADNSRWNTFTCNNFLYYFIREIEIEFSFFACFFSLLFLLCLIFKSNCFNSIWIKTEILIGLEDNLLLSQMKYPFVLKEAFLKFLHFY